MNKKRYYIIILLTLVTVLLTVFSCIDTQAKGKKIPYKIQVGVHKIDSLNAAYKYIDNINPNKNSYYIDIRTLEYLGAKITYNSKTKTYIATIKNINTASDHITLKFQKNSSLVNVKLTYEIKNKTRVNHRTFNMRVSPQISKDTIYIPMNKKFNMFKSINYTFSEKDSIDDQKKIIYVFKYQRDRCNNSFNSIFDKTFISYDCHSYFNKNTKEYKYSLAIAKKYLKNHNINKHLLSWYGEYSSQYTKHFEEYVNNPYINFTPPSNVGAFDEYTREMGLYEARYEIKELKKNNKDLSVKQLGKEFKVLSYINKFYYSFNANVPEINNIYYITSAYDVMKLKKTGSNGQIAVQQLMYDLLGYKTRIRYAYQRRYLAVYINGHWRQIAGDGFFKLSASQTFNRPY